jgi:hypothetical protein
LPAVWVPDRQTRDGSGAVVRAGSGWWMWLQTLGILGIVLAVMVLVRFRGRILLLGLGPQNLDVLSEVGDPAEAAQILAPLEGGKPGSISRDFRQTIDAAVRQYDRTGKLEPAVEEPVRPRRRGRNRYAPPGPEESAGQDAVDGAEGRERLTRLRQAAAALDN